jgi:hypothetical protein
MRYLVRLSTAALVGLVASLVTFTAAPAAVTALPKIQAYNITGWSGMVKRPGHITIGQGGAPEVYRLSWSRWTASSGKATGKIELFWCAVFANCKPTVHNVTVWANTPRTHAGQSYPHFSHLVYQYVNAKGVTKRLSYTFAVHPGGSVPSWT